MVKRALPLQISLELKYCEKPRLKLPCISVLNETG
jgi:hypothetical protein